MGQQQNPSGPGFWVTREVPGTEGYDWGPARERVWVPQTPPPATTPPATTPPPVLTPPPEVKIPPNPVDEALIVPDVKLPPPFTGNPDIDNRTTTDTDTTDTGTTDTEKKTKIEPPYEDLWGSYSRWVGEAGERYQEQVRKIGRLPGLGAEARTSTLAKMEEEYQGELRGFQDTETYRQLFSGWEATGKQGTLEDYYRGQYGGYTSETTPETISRTVTEARRGPRPGAVIGTAADIAGLGAARPWWSL